MHCNKLMVLSSHGIHRSDRTTQLHLVSSQELQLKFVGLTVHKFLLLPFFLVADSYEFKTHASTKTHQKGIEIPVILVSQVALSDERVK